jgi:hypothetical protein
VASAARERLLDQIFGALSQEDRATLLRLLDALDDAARPLDNAARPLDEAARPLDEAARPLDDAARPLSASPAAASTPMVPA